MERATKQNKITIEDRFVGGFFSIQEVVDLKNSSRTQVYVDIKAGRLPVEKFGRATRIAGPVAKAYVPGRGLAA